jgi:hypothetical protein
VAHAKGWIETIDAQSVKHKWRGTTCGDTNVYHEYIMQTDDPELVKQIRDSKIREMWKGHVSRILILEGYKYWLCSPVINRRKLPEPKEVGATRLK